MKYPREDSSDINMVICGKAGQGIQTLEEIMVKSSKRSGLHVFSIKEYMSRVRGGSNSTSIRIGTSDLRAPVKRMDIALPLSKGAIEHIKWRSDERTTFLLDAELAGDMDLEEHGPVIDIDVRENAENIGGTIYENTISAGILCSLLNMDKRLIKDIFKDRFGGSSGDVHEKNNQALDVGFSIGEEIKEQGKLSIELERKDDTGDRITIKGIEAIFLGALSGGCDLISSYPMSPSTGVLAGLASRQAGYGLIAEQAEDEISAVNMGLGAWYAGGRAMVTTSGGGFSLMAEGLSLAGMLEMPMVFHLAQRPGPATGLPTRTEQGDLFLGLFSGHGEFPRVIFAPGSPEEGFELTRRAFDIADRFQVPVIIMTDQYMVDSGMDVESGKFNIEIPERHVVRTDEDYRRYEFSDNGISERGIPGNGKGLVNVDSDEHDEEGHITESMETRELMVEKRMSKLELLKKEALSPGLIGEEEGDVVVCWGSNLGTVAEAVRTLDNEISLVHFSQVYPLSSDVEKVLSRFDRKICLENNYTGQLEKLLSMEAGIRFDHSIRKYNGLPFTVEEIAGSLQECLDPSGRCK